MLGYFNNEAQPVADKVEISDHSVVTPDGTTLLARWYRQPSGDSRAAVLYLHGGGMIVGSVPIFDGPVSRYVARTGVSMLSLEYRLAPEHPHPAPVEDAYAGLVWLTGHAAERGIDPGRIAVMGDSAGGGLAAGAAILSRDRKGPAVARHLLIYAMLDDRTTTPDPYIAPFAGWSYDDNATGWNVLLGTGHEDREIDSSAAPGRLADATGLPPAYIEVGQLDIFRDEDIRYALALSRAGRPGRTAPAPRRAARVRRHRLRSRRVAPCAKRPRPRAAELVTPGSRENAFRTFRRDSPPRQPRGQSLTSLGCDDRGRRRDDRGARHQADRCGTRAVQRDQQGEDLVGPIFFLASPDSDFTSGQILNVDGGLTTH